MSTFEKIELIVLTERVENVNGGSFQLNWKKGSEKGSVIFKVGLEKMDVKLTGDKIEPIELLHAFYDDFTVRYDYKEFYKMVDGELNREIRSEEQKKPKKERIIYDVSAYVWGPRFHNDGGVRFAWNSSIGFGTFDFFLKNGIVFVDGEMMSHDFIRNTLTAFISNKAK